MPSTTEKAITGISSLAQHIRAQEVSPVEVVKATLKRIETLNQELNAFITVMADEALEQAHLAEREIRQSRWRGPLHGIPVGVKDFYDTAATRTTAAFEQFKDRVPAKDAVVVQRLKEAGAIIIGKTNMHRLGAGTTGLDGAFGPACNPWNADYIPGGSSSGSAAAIASGMCYATVDTDAIGSCRLPAACCGVVGFKGTYGLLSPLGILAGEQDPGKVIRWLSHPGITTARVEDTAIVLDALAERAGSATTGYQAALATGRTLRIGLANNLQVDSEVQAAFENAATVIRDLGYSMSSSSIPFRSFEDGFNNIESDRATIAGRIFQDIDVLLLPTTVTSVPTVLEARDNPQALSPHNTLFANYYGFPAISMPCGFDSKGLPFGLQIVGKPWDEAAVLRLAYQYEAATPSTSRRPFS
jgi:aspartyl-tRNA(Asn)/glutamyl-tRNA(Gln) amidotransferase subunit A